MLASRELAGGNTFNVGTQELAYSLIGIGIPRIITQDAPGGRMDLAVVGVVHSRLIDSSSGIRDTTV